MKGIAMELTEKKLKSELIFDGKIVHLYKDTVELPNGKEATREVIRHVGAVGVIPVTENGEFILVKQFRYPFGEVLTEIPAGKLDSKDEDIIEAVKRELREETGVTAEELYFLGDLIPSCAILDEVIHLFMAKGLSYGDCDPDDDEFLNVVRVPIMEAVGDVMEGKIRDSKTQVAILKASMFVRIKELEKDMENEA
jgi:ADP-ribose pyrophosphatase